MIGAGHHRLAAGKVDGGGDGEIVGGDDDAADGGLHRTTPDMDDHGMAADIGERLARQAGGAHAGGNDDDGAFAHGFNLKETSRQKGQ